ncbi:hypothetical protein ACFSCX_18030 [Bacillus salitolerans]|uniref:Tetratrico peptide repeat group 5 domain-containing protein n=1 Tax=Bacillus salitolerans TaxID=1437434 RepID=A0ABW4LTF9_9BACI
MLERAIREYPNALEFQSFFALTLYNLKEYEQAFGIMVRLLAETSSDKGIERYNRSLMFYSDKLEHIWK